MGRNETDRKITSELWSSMPGRMNTKENEREKLFQVKRKKSAQKVFDRADTVRDLRSTFAKKRRVGDSHAPFFFRD